jgi:hypothetical protein
VTLARGKGRGGYSRHEARKSHLSFRVYTEFREHLRQRHPKHFGLLERLERGHIGGSFDLETLLADLLLATSAAPSLRLLDVAVDPTSLFSEELAELRGFLDAFIIDTCERFDRKTSASELLPILKLRALGPLWIFTTNYDRLVEQACEQNAIDSADGFEGEIGDTVADYTGVFEKEVRVVKLHGSVNWYQDNPDGGLHRLDRGYSLPSKDFALVREGQRLTPLMIIPTLEKQVLDKPYAQLTVRLTDTLRELPLLIVAGNSLRDKYLLNFISDRLPRLQVLFLSPNASGHVLRLGLGTSTHSLDIGFREFLTTSGLALEQLGLDVQAAQTPEAVAEAVRAFVAEVTTNAQSDEIFTGNAELGLYNRMLTDPSVAQRARAASALATHSHPAVVRRLRSVLREDSSESVRAAAVGSLIAIGTTDAIEAACAGLGDGASAVQLEAVTGLLSRLPNTMIVERLEAVRPTLSKAAKNILDSELPAVSA